MKKLRYIIMVMTVAALSSCHYLDVVPDGVVEISSKFTTQAGVRQALGKCYEYMPDMAYVHGSVTLAGDEYCCPSINATFTTGGSCRGLWLVRGLQTSASPSLSFWNGSNGGQNLYEGIRYCNIFLENIHNVVGVPDKMVNDWVAQVKVLKAYYHFFLIQCYGPILIYDKSLDLSASADDMRKPRQPLEECFQYVVNLLNEALNSADFSDSRRNSTTENLLLDKVIARAIKAKVLILRASPIFNGNSMYKSFTDNDGKLLIDAEHYAGDEVWLGRWENARDACKEAIDAAEKVGRTLYVSNGTTKDWDRAYWATDGTGSDIIKYCYSLRYAVVDPNVASNTELIWGAGTTRNFSGNYTMQTATQIRTGQLVDAAGNFYNDDGNTKSTYSFGWMGASFDMEEAFYSKNGVPISEDKTYDYTGRFDLTKVPSDSYHISYMADGTTTVKLHLNREPRYYAWLLVDAGCYRDYDRLIPKISMLYGDTSAPGGGTAIEGSSAYDLLQSGIGIKKLVHPDTKNQYSSNVVMYPFPLIRLADLYLLYAEALTECNDLTNAKVYLNKVRERAGLQDVDTAWGTYSTSPDKPNTQAGLLEIIKQERRVELCFEGHRYFDVVRWLEGASYFTSPIRGWTYTGTKASAFYNTTNIYSKQWSNKNYLWPIPTSELQKNPRLVQNPLW